MYDGRNMPYHAANKLNNLKQNPKYTYAEAAAKGSKEVQENRKVTDKVRQTYDPNQKKASGERVPNHRDEFPHAGTVVEEKGDDRKSQTNVAPVPERESRGRPSCFSKPS